MNENQTEQIGSGTAIRPTKRQQGILEFIDVFIKEHGYSPSYREIMNGLGYTSVATVALHVNNLIKRGHLIKRGRSARSLELTKPLGGEDLALIKTNLVSANEEKWLVDKVAYIFDDAASQALVPDKTIDELKALITTLELLGMDAASSKFKRQLNDMIIASQES